MCHRDYKCERQKVTLEKNKSTVYANLLLIASLRQDISFAFMCRWL